VSDNTEEQQMLKSSVDTHGEGTRTFSGETRSMLNHQDLNDKVSFQDQSDESIHNIEDYRCDMLFSTSNYPSTDSGNSTTNNSDQHRETTTNDLNVVILQSTVEYYYYHGIVFFRFNAQLNQSIQMSILMMIIGVILMKMKMTNRPSVCQLKKHSVI